MVFIEWKAGTEFGLSSPPFFDDSLKCFLINGFSHDRKFVSCGFFKCIPHFCLFYFRVIIAKCLMAFKYVIIQLSAFTISSVDNAFFDEFFI